MALTSFSSGARKVYLPYCRVGISDGHQIMF